MTRISLALIAVVLVIAIACKKTKNEDPIPEDPQTQNPTTGSITMNKTSYMPFEVAEITCNGITLNDTSYNVVVSGTVSVAKKYNSKLYVVMPNIISGNYVLALNVSSKSYTSSFNLQVASVIPDPQVYFQGVITGMQNINQNNQTILNSLSSVTEIYSNPSYQQGINSVNNYLSALTTSFNALSSTDKAMLVQLLDANKHWTDEFQTAVDNLDYTVPTYMKSSLFFDKLEEIFTARIQQYGIPAVTSGAVVSSIVTYGAVGLVFGASIAPAVAAVYVGVKVAQFGMASYEASLNADLTNNYAAVATDCQGSFKMASVNASSLITNNIEKQLNLPSEYRSLYSADGTSSVTSISKYSADLNMMYDNHLKIMSYAPSLNIAPPKKLSQINSPKTYNLNVHSDYITINNISDPNVNLVSTNKVNGALYLKFNTNKTTNQPFSFNINYSSPTGQFVKTVNAELVMLSPCFFMAVGLGLPPYTYQWSNGHTFDTLTVNPNLTTVYTCTVNNALNNPSIQSFTCSR